MSHWPLLSLVTFLPLLGAFLILVTRGEEAVVARNARMIALWTALIDFALSLVLWADFDPHKAGFQFVERARWVSGFRCSLSCCRPF
jgi:NADH-quinone oxidoreductase subunit M